MMGDPLHDDSRPALVGGRFETPQILIDMQREMLRDYFGDEIADAIFPPPYGTLGDDDA